MGAKGDLEIGLLCDRCTACDTNAATDDKTLYELAHMDEKSVTSLMNECRYNMKGLHEKAWEHAKQRRENRQEQMAGSRDALREMNESFSYKVLEELLEGGNIERLMEEYLSDEERKRLEEELAAMDMTEEGIEPEDIRNSLKEYVEKDLLEVNKDGIRITPKGSGKLAKYVLRRIWENLAAVNTGTNETKEEGFGVSHGFGLRKYEYGDEFDRIDMEATLMSALERNRPEGSPITFEEEDLWVKETTVDTRLCVGLVVDESGSMSGEKIHAAMDISMALSELIRRNAKDKMKFLLFSNQVREIPHWDMLNVTFAGGTTDIRGALKRFRQLAANETADKQVYLITDTEPNCEDGKYIGFEKATLGVVREAMAYQREGITLNIIMLDNTPHLKEFATILAKRNLGRVFFAEPKELGKVVVEDYLRSKKRQKMKKAV